MKPKPTQVDARTLELFERLVKTIPGVERKGATLPYTSRNGHMFSFVTKEGRVALRLPDEQRGAFLSKFRTVLCEQHGVVMKEYVLVPDALLTRTSELKPWFAQSHAYVGALKPKPTTRKKKLTDTKPREPAAKKAAKPSTRSRRKT